MLVKIGRTEEAGRQALSHTGALAGDDAMTRRLDGRIRVDGYLVQEMVSGLEVIAGFREDPQYGPFAVVGLGGVLVEALNDTSLRLLPVTPEDVREMVAELRSAALFGSFRGEAPRDVDALSRAISELGAVFLEFRSGLSDLELNPIVVGAKGQGVWAVDVRQVWRDLEARDVAAEEPSGNVGPRETAHEFRGLREHQSRERGGDRLSGHRSTGETQRDEPFDGTKAAEMGLINKAVPREQLKAEVVKLANEMRKKNPEVLRATKQAVRRVRGMDYFQALDYLAAKLAEIRQRDPEDAFHEGLKQFLDDKSYRPTFSAYDRRSGE